jgi:hypothetical protein
MTSGRDRRAIEESLTLTRKPVLKYKSNINQTRNRKYSERMRKILIKAVDGSRRLTEESLCASAGSSTLNRKDFDFGSHLQLSLVSKCKRFCASERF